MSIDIRSIEIFHDSRHSEARSDVSFSTVGPNFVQDDWITAGTEQETDDTNASSMTIGHFPERSSSSLLLLFGREKEVTALQRFYDKVASNDNDNNDNKRGFSKLVVVSGSPGSGKSVLVDRALRSYVSDRKGYFTEGKFDQLTNSTAPFSAIVAAFTDLCSLLVGSDELEQIRAKLWQDFAVEDIAILNRLISMVGYLAGTQDDNSDSSTNNNNDGDDDADDFSVSHSSGSIQAFVRFRQLCCSFLGKVSSPKHPIVIFLDDLQWADPLSLDVMNAMFEDPTLKHILFVVSFRTNEFDEGRLWQGKARSHIWVEDLEENELNKVVASHLSSQTNELMTFPLTQVVMCKTRGNPYFARQFLESLKTKGLLRRRRHRNSGRNGASVEWEWDVVRIQEETDVSDNVVELLKERIRGLEPPVQMVLQIAAHVGHQFRFALLLAVVEDGVFPELLLSAGQQKESALRIMGVTIREGLVESVESSKNQTYKFTHDRVQQCLIAMVSSGDNKENFHLRLGRSLFKHYTTNNKIEKNTFLLAVNHLNQGSRQVSAEERATLARHNLEAAKVTLTRSDMESAKDYTRKGIALLDADTRWSKHYELSLDLHSTLAELGECTGDFQQSSGQVNDIMRHARSPPDKLRAYSATMETRLAQNRLTAALDVGFDYVELLGHKLPRKANSVAVKFELVRTKSMLKGMTDEQLLNLPLTNDRGQISVITILHNIAYVAYQKGNETPVFCLASSRIVRLSCAGGLTGSSAFGFACFAAALAHMNEMALAYRYAKIALQLIGKLGAKELECRTIGVVYHTVMHWKEPFKQCAQVLEASHEVGRVTTDIPSSFLSACGATVLSHHCGASLKQTVDRLESICRQMTEFKQEESLRLILPFFQVVLNLKGDCFDPAVLEGKAMDWLIGIHAVAENELVSGRLESAARLELAVDFDNLGLAEHLLPQVSTGKYKPAPAHYSSVFGTFKSAMANYELYRTTRRVKFRRRAGVLVRRMARWFDMGGVNCHSPLLIMRAEAMAVRGGHCQASVLSAFDEATKAAQEMSFRQQEAIAFERAAVYLFHEAPSTHPFFHYAARAMAIYSHWGAHGKVEFLEKKFNMTMQSVCSMAMEQPSEVVGNEHAVSNAYNELESFAALQPHT